MRGLAVAQLNRQGAFRIAGAIAGGPVAISMVGRVSLGSSGAVGFEEDEAAAGGPRGKMAEVREKAESIEDIQRFEASANRANVPLSCELSLERIAPGIRHWGYFREMTGGQHFPLPQEAALALSAPFSTGRTSQQYLPRRAKASILLGRSLARETKAVSQAAEGLASSCGRMRAPKAAVSRSLFMEMSNSNPSFDAFVQAVWAGWALLLRVQSECLPLVGRLSRERLDEDSALRAPAVGGTCNGHTAIKLHRRQHMAAGSRMVSKCICDEYPAGSLEIRVPRLFSTVCFSWEMSAAVSARVHSYPRRRPGQVPPISPGGKKSTDLEPAVSEGGRLGLFWGRRQLRAPA